MEDENNHKYSYLMMQYKEGINVIKFWLECRYKILQFIGYFNAAVLTFGFSQGVLLSKEAPFGGMIICLLSIFVAGMGLATEFSNSSYLFSYFKTLREIEEILGKDNLGESGIFTHGAIAVDKNTFHRIFPVNRAHKLFYFLLIVLWSGLAIYHAAMPDGT
jgi:hypothetical protein